MTDSSYSEIEERHVCLTFDIECFIKNDPIVIVKFSYCSDGLIGYENEEKVDINELNGENIQLNDLEEILNECEENDNIKIKISYDDDNIDKLEHIIYLAISKSAKIRVIVFKGKKNGYDYEERIEDILEKFEINKLRKEFQEEINNAISSRNCIAMTRNEAYDICDMMVLYLKMFDKNNF